MKIFFSHRALRAQTSLEYLLLLAVVAVVVVASFRSGGLIDNIRNSAGGYYDTATRVIMGQNPKPINGGWCSVSCPPSGTAGPTTLYRSCECPPPAFGGKYCSGSSAVTCNGVVDCGICPAGQVCDPQTGKCGCSNDLSCGHCPDGTLCGSSGATCTSCPSPVGSVSDSTCTSCICPSGTSYNSSINSCDGRCPTPCTSWDNTTNSCQSVDCTKTFSANSYCDPSKPAAQECQCDNYAYYDASSKSCVPCTADGNNCTKPNSDGTACADISCPGYSYCNTSSNSCDCDESPDNNFCTAWNGSACVLTACCSTTQSCASGQTCHFINSTQGYCS